MASSTLTADEFNAIFGDMTYLKHKLRTKVPATHTTNPDKTSKGYPIATEQWEKDSGLRDLVMDCQYLLEDGPAQCIDRFTHVPTVRGVCSTFNARSLEDVFKTDTVWMESFLK